MRARRHVPGRNPDATSPSRSGSGSGSSRSLGRWLRDIAIVTAVFAIGYVAVVLWIAPTPRIGGKDHSLPRVLGRADADARAELEAAGFKPKVAGSRPHPTARAGTVIWQDPPPGVVLPPSTTVTLTLSAGATPVPVPDIVGLDTATARRILLAAGVTVGDVTVIAGRRQEPGIVIATRPAVGATRPRGASVGLVVSQGDQTLAPVPPPDQLQERP